MNTNTISYGSVCSGIEAASVAWEVLGFSPAWFSQFDPEHKYKNGPDFPSAVLAHHWPEVPNLGDMTKLAAKMRTGEMAAPDILVGGTPCQAFSVAGARAGLSDPRGQLTISYGELADAIDDRRAAAGLPPAIIVWENVPGVLSSKDNAFGAFLGLLAGEDCELQPPGKRWANAGCVLRGKRAIAWRILDAQYFGVAQRRRRVFVVASARTDIDPAQILFERDGVRRDTAPSRSAGKAVAALTANGVGTCGAEDNQGQAGHLIPQCVTGDISHTLKAEGFDGSEDGTGRGTPIIGAYRMRAFGEYADDETASTVKARDYKDATDLAVMSVHGTQDPDTLRNMAHTLGRNHGQENAVIAFSSKDNGQDAANELSPTLRAGGHSTSHANAGAPPAVAYGIPGNWIGRAPENGGNATEPMHDVAPCLTVADRHGVAYAGFDILGTPASEVAKEADVHTPLRARVPGQFENSTVTMVANGMAVRRLTPVECERLQGFPDNHTLIPTDKRKQITAEEYAYLRHHFPNMTAEEAYRLAADGPRYKAIGNSMAVPVMRWIGERIMKAMYEADSRKAAKEAK